MKALIMPRSTLDLRSIASSGGGMILDARHYSVLDLRSIASSASANQNKITLMNVNHLSTLDLRSIASSGNGCVIFNFIS